MSWDVYLQRFDQGDEVNFDLEHATSVLRRSNGFREAEPGVGELEGDGSAEIYYGAEPSSDVMVSVRVASPTVMQLIYDLAAELRMAVFFPNEESWSTAIVEESQVHDLPDPTWDGWENFEDGFTPPPPVVCRNADELAAVLAPSYAGWETWTRRRE